MTEFRGQNKQNISEVFNALENQIRQLKLDLISKNKEFDETLETVQRIGFEREKLRTEVGNLRQERAIMNDHLKDLKAEKSTLQFQLAEFTNEE